MTRNIISQGTFVGVMSAFLLMAILSPLKSNAAETVTITQTYPYSFNLLQNTVFELGVWFLRQPRITVEYEVAVIDKMTQAPISKGDEVSFGQKLWFMFKPHESRDITWFVDPASYVRFTDTRHSDSPYGVWVDGAELVPLQNVGSVLSSVSCSGSTGDKGVPASCSAGYSSVNAGLGVNPPTKSFVPSTDLSCGTLERTVSGDWRVECEVVGPNPTGEFVFEETFARFSAPKDFLHPFVYTTAALNGPAKSGYSCSDKGISCYSYSTENDLTSYALSARLGGDGGSSLVSAPTYNLEQIITGGGRTVVARDTNAGSAFRATIPRVTVPYPLTSRQNAAPTPPLIAAPTTACVGTEVDITLSGGTDPDGDTIRYGVSFAVDGTSPGVWAPLTGYVPSGSAEVVKRRWYNPGTRVIRAMTQDKYSLASAWTEKTIEVSNTGICAPAISVLLTANRPEVNTGDKVELTWSTTGNPTSCEASAIPAHNEWNETTDLTPLSYGNIPVTLDRTTNFRITCERDGREVADTVRVEALAPVCTPVYVCSADGTKLIDTTCDSDDVPCPAGCTAFGDACTPRGTADLVINPLRVRSGNTTQLWWSTSGEAGECIVSAPGHADIPLVGAGGGPTTTQPITYTTPFTMQCTNADPDTETVTIIPQIIEF